MKNNTICQSENSFSYVIAFYGRCEPGQSCTNYEMDNESFKEIVDSVFQIDSEQNGKTFAWYKSDLSGTIYNRFSNLECGHLYYFVIKPGIKTIEIDNLYITSNKISEKYNFSDNARITEQCEYKDDCCLDFVHTVNTLGTLDETPSIGGVKVFGFENGGTLCYNSLEYTFAPGRYNFKTLDNKVVGHITTTGNIVDKKFVYKTLDGVCYEASAETQNGFNILYNVNIYI